MATFPVPSALLHFPVAAVSQQARLRSAGAEALPGQEFFFSITSGPPASRAVLVPEAVQELASYSMGKEPGKEVIAEGCC